MPVDSARSRAAIAVLLAAGVGFGFDVTFTWASGYWPPVPYLVLCGGLVLAAALLVAAMSALLRRGASVGLALWAVACGALGPYVGIDAAVLAVGAGLVTLGWGRFARRFAGEAARGVAVGGAFALALCALPVEGAVLILAAYAGVLGLALVAAWLAHRFLRWPSLVRSSLTVLVATVAGTALWTNLVLLVSDGPRGDPERRVAGPTIIVLVLDTVRAASLSLYGHTRETDPSLKEFVESAGRVRVYPQAYAPSPWTLPSHASLFTGLLPSEHGAQSRRWQALFEGGDVAELKAKVTLAETLKQQGYRTVAVFANPVLLAFPGLSRGFDEYTWAAPRTRALRGVGEGIRFRRFGPWMAYAVEKTPRAETINRKVLRQLDYCDVASCFILANYMDVHDPFAPTPDVAGAFSNGATLPSPLHANMMDGERSLRRAEDAYDEMILGLDAKIGELLRELDARGILDRSWIVITSDHGEAFGEHGVARHGTGVYDEQVRIPLLVRPPRGEQLPPFRGPVSLIDVAATLSRVAGAPALGHGRDLRDPEPAPVGIQFFGFVRAAKYGPPDLEVLGALADTPARAVVSGKDKLIDYGDRVELYRLNGDAEERTDLAGTRPGLATALRAELPGPDFVTAEAEADRGTDSIEVDAVDPAP